MLFQGEGAPWTDQHERGKFASNNGFQGTLIWSDGSPQASADTFRNTANNEAAFRATGGFRFRTNLGWSCDGFPPSS